MSFGRGKVDFLKDCSRVALLSSVIGIAGLQGIALAQDKGTDIQDASADAKDAPQRTFTLTPFISGKESFSDNVFSTEDGEQADFITTVEAGVDLKNESRRSTIDFSYTLSKDIYADNSELNGTRHNMLGNGEVILLEDWLKFNANIAISEQNVSQTGSTTATDRTASSDRTRVINYGLGPTLVHSFGRWASTELGYKYKGVDFKKPSTGASSSAPANATIQEITYNLESGPKFGNLDLAFDSSYTNTDKAEGADTERSNAQIRGEYAFTTHFSGIARVGVDKYNGDDSSEQYDGGYGFLGGRIRFSERLDASLEIGNRNDNNTFTADVSYRPTPRTEFTLSHDQSVQTQQETLSTEPIFVNGILVNPNDLGTTLVDSTTRTRRLDASFTHRRKRTEFKADVGWRQRDFAVDNTDDATLNLGVDVSHDFTKKATGTLNVKYSDTLDTRTDNTDQTSYRMGMDLDYDLSDTLVSKFGYSVLYRTEEAGQDIVENVFFVSLRKDF